MNQIKAAYYKTTYCLESQKIPDTILAKQNGMAETLVAALEK